MKRLIAGTLFGALLVAMTFSLSQAKDEAKLKFVGAAKCKMCHNMKSSGKYFDDWIDKKHAQAFYLLKGDEQKNPDCLKCHTTGYGEPGGFTVDKLPVPFAKFEDMKKSSEISKYVKGMFSVQCEMCHGPGEKHIKSKRNKEVIPHAWEPDEKTCAKCHNDTNPNWNPEKYTDEDGKKSGFDYKQAVKIISHKVEKKKK